MEGRAFVQAALDPDAAAVQLDELPADAQAESAAAERPRAAGVELLELGEHRVELVGRDADARVRDAVAHAVAVARRADVDAAALGELEGVAGEVEQALADALGVADHDLRHALLHARREVE